MAPSQKKMNQDKPQSPNFFLSCFGFSREKTWKNDGKPKTKKKFRLSWIKLGIMKRPLATTKKKKRDLSDHKPLSLPPPPPCGAIKVKTSKMEEEKQLYVSKSTMGLNHQIPMCNTKFQKTNNIILRKPAKDATCRAHLSEAREAKDKSKTYRFEGVNKVDHDALVAISSLVVTLMIMLFCGKLCAILCMSIWLYCTACLRAIAINHCAQNESSSGPGLCLDPYPNSDSVLYKKKVILEGLLQRNYKVK